MNKFDILQFSVSATTRYVRNGEINGKDYYFMSVEQFREKINNNEFIEYEEVYNNTYYGTLKSEIERIWRNKKIVLFEVDVKGGIKLKEYFGEKSLSIFIKPPSIKELEKRLIERGKDSEDKIRERVEKAKEEMKYMKYFDVVLENKDLNKTFLKIEKVVAKFLNIK